MNKDYSHEIKSSIKNTKNKINRQMQENAKKAKLKDESQFCLKLDILETQKTIQIQVSKYRWGLRNLPQCKCPNVDGDSETYLNASVEM